MSTSNPNTAANSQILNTTPTSAGSGYETAGQELTTLADEVAKVLFGGVIGSQKTIPNALATGELNTTILTSTPQIVAYRESVADQLNAQAACRCETLTDRIADITINTTAQGAGTLEIQVIDPTWSLGTSGFIQADENGYLYPPILINFPSGTDCYWELCQMAATTDLSQPQWTLTFEDRNVSLLRQIGPAVHGAIAQGDPTDTLGGFIKRLVDNANSVLKPNPPIRLVEMISPADPNYKHPAGAPSPRSSPVRSNPNKTKTGLTPTQQAQIAASQAMIVSLFGDHSLSVPDVGTQSKRSYSMPAVEQNYAAAWSAYVQAIEAHPYLAGGGTEYP